MLGLVDIKGLLDKVVRYKCSVSFSRMYILTAY